VKTAPDYTREESRDPPALAAPAGLARLTAAAGSSRLAGAVLVVSTALQVAGPALIAFGINQALRAFWRRATGCRRS
jgi:ATP-binding cassette subfamily B protein